MIVRLHRWSRIQSDPLIAGALHIKGIGDVSSQPGIVGGGGGYSSEISQHSELKKNKKKEKEKTLANRSRLIETSATKTRPCDSRLC